MQNNNLMAFQEITKNYLIKNWQHSIGKLFVTINNINLPNKKLASLIYIDSDKVPGFSVIKNITWIYNEVTDDKDIFVDLASKAGYDPEKLKMEQA